MQELTRAAVEDAFREIGESLYRARKFAEIAVYYGAAIMLQFEVTFRTADVDVQVESGDHGALMQNVLRRYFPKEPADARRIAVVRQFAEKLNAAGDAG